MKKKVLKIAAVILAAVMLLSLGGCTDILNSYMDYSYGDYSDGSDYYTDGGATYEELLNQYLEAMGGLSGTQGGGTTGGSGGDPVTISENVLGEAIRDQFTEIKGNGKDVVTVMVYMCASNLESESGLATEDIKEMIRATANSNLNIVIETGGCSKWHTSSISSSTNQRHLISGGHFDTIESKLGKRSMTKAETLTDFIQYSAEKFPANRYMLILWDHGAGSVDGWGCDEYSGMDTLTIDELGEALYASEIKFDFIGFDACLMSTMEVACVLYDFADYMIASEDYESGYGWEYQPWLSALAENTSTPTPELGKRICDDFVKESGNTAAIMAIMDLSYMKLVYTSWKDFAYAAEDQLLDANFSWETQNQGGRYGWEDLLNSIFTTETDIQDMLAIARSVKNVEEAEPLISALTNCILYCAANSQDSHMTGMAVTLPYGSSSQYKKIQNTFAKAGFEDEYITYLGKFAGNSSAFGDYYDWSNWYDDWDGWDQYNGWESWDGYSNGGYDDYGWLNWNGWDQYNDSDYGWSDSNDYFDYYDFFGFGDGNGSGYGNGYGNGYGSGYGNGYGSGYGNGYGSGYGSGYGNGYGSSDGGYGDMWDIFQYFFGN